MASESNNNGTVKVRLVRGLRGSPVSYTHLDVYKRQALYGKYIRRSTKLHAHDLSLIHI